MRTSTHGACSSLLRRLCHVGKGDIDPAAVRVETEVHLAVARRDVGGPQNRAFEPSAGFPWGFAVKVLSGFAFVERRCLLTVVEVVEHAVY